MTAATVTNSLNENRPDLPDDIFLHQLEDTSLRASAFDHRGHIRAAVLYFRRFGFEQGRRQFDQVLRRYAKSLGVPEKYHRTLTLALLHLIYVRLGEDDQTWAVFEEQNRDLFERPKALLARHYSPALLDSDRARARFAKPDRCPLPQFVSRNRDNERKKQIARRSKMDEHGGR